MSDNQSVNLNISDHVHFARENMTLAVCTNRKNQACFICDHIDYKSYRYVAQTMIDNWSSSFFAKIFFIGGVAVGFTPNTAAFCWLFQTNKQLSKSEHLVLVTVYWKILKIIVVNLTLYSYPNQFDANSFRAQSLYDLNQILIRCLQSKFTENKLVFLRANDPYLELWWTHIFTTSGHLGKTAN